MSVGIERQLEDSLASAITISGVNIYKSDYEGDRLLPSLTIQVSIASEEVVPFSGVFRCNGNLVYSERADIINRADLDTNWYAILQTFYQSPSIESILTTSTLEVFQCKVTNEEPGIVTDRRIWSKTTSLSILCTSK